MAASDAPTRAIGTLSGGWSFGQTHSGWVTDVLENVPDLTWPMSVQTYARMRHDATIASTLSAYLHPILRARWAVDPRGASPQACRDVADSLGLPVLGAADEDQPGPARVRGVQWIDHVRLAFLAYVFGHMAFEPVYDLTTGRALLAALPERMPQTIRRIVVGGDGMMQGIDQSADPRLEQAGQVEIPYDPDPGRSRLLWYVNAREGAAWQGQSILRSCFGPWIIKQDMMRVQGVSIRRFGAGTPVMEPLPGTTPTDAQVKEATRAAAALRVGEQGGAATPGFTLRIKGVEGTIPDALPYLRYLDEQMARSALTSALDLGSTPNGSRALGMAFLDIMAMAQQGVAEQIATTATRLAVALTDYNEGPDAPSPAVVVGDVASSERVQAEMVAQLVASGALVMDDDLQAWLRKVLKLPQSRTPVVPVRVPAAGEAPGAGPVATPAPAVPTAAPPTAAVPSPRPVGAARRPAPAGTPQPTARARDVDRSWPYRRELTAVELKAGYDPQQQDQDLGTILADLQRRWPGIVAAQRTQLADQIAASLASQDPTTLTALAVDAGAAGDLLEAAVLKAAAAGVEQAVAEAADQGVDLPPPDVDAASLGSWARTLAVFMGASLAQTAGREALRLWDTTRDANGVADDVLNHLEGLSAAVITDQLGGVINGGMNAGRSAAVAGHDGKVTLYASEIRDASTCEACAAIDGHEFASQEEADASYISGGFIDCYGRWRCRGALFSRYGEEDDS